MCIFSQIRFRRHDSILPKVRRAIFVTAVLSLSASGSAVEEFPKELEDFAKTLNCTPRKEAPFKWGVIKGIPERHSAVFWCVGKRDAKRVKLASFTLFIRPGSNVPHPCPSTLPEQYVFDRLEVWESGSIGRKKVALDTLRYIDTGKAGEKSQTAKDYIIEASADQRSVGIYFYCDRGRWMAHSYD